MAPIRARTHVIVRLRLRPLIIMPRIVILFDPPPPPHPPPTSCRGGREGRASVEPTRAPHVWLNELHHVFEHVARRRWRGQLFQLALGVYLNGPERDKPEGREDPVARAIRRDSGNQELGDAS
eukprot:2096508-Pyramimonas_sp.AAC.1